MDTDMKLVQAYINFVIVVVGCNATVQLILEDFQLVYSCYRHEEELGHEHPNASLIKLN